MHFLDKIVNKNCKVLDVGAGAGRYAFYFTDKGCKVKDLDITPKHVDIMKEKASKKNVDLDVGVGNALALRLFYISRNGKFNE